MSGTHSLRDERGIVNALVGISRLCCLSVFHGRQCENQGTTARFKTTRAPVGEFRRTRDDSAFAVMEWHR